MEPRMDTDEMRVEAHNHSADHPSLICTANLRNHCGVRRISGSLPGGAASRDCGAAAQKRIQRRCSKAMHAEHADASVRLQDRRSRIRYRRTRVAGIESQAEPRLSPHPRVLRASPGCICDEILALRCAGRCWRTHCQARVAAHAAGATPWQSACMAPVLVAANGCAAASVVQKT